jgi:hypothetical protein
MSLYGCVNCKEKLDICMFNKDKSRKNGIKIYCKNCCKQRYIAKKDKISKRQKERRSLDIEKYKKHARERYAKDKEKNRKKQKDYFYKNYERIKAYRLKRYRENIEVERKKRRDYYNSLSQESKFKKNRKNYLRNKQKIIERSIKRRKIRLKIDPVFLLKETIKARLAGAFRRKNITKKTLSILRTGCDFDFLKKYIESKFVEGMSWENKELWHIDHIKPLSSFDLTDEEQLKEACHYTNLQPLWAYDNLSKGSLSWEEYKLKCEKKSKNENVL